jgi:hypothetical protein
VLDAADARGIARALEGSGVAVEELLDRGLTHTELEALELLTHVPTESYELYVLRIARAEGAAGRLARTVKLADLDEQIARGPLPAGAPPYAWARRRVALARARLGEDVAAALERPA